MSRINQHIVNKYNSYSEALSAILSGYGVEQKWLAGKLSINKQSLNSLQQMISRWINGQTPSARYRNEINTILHQEFDLNIIEKEDFWAVTDSFIDADHLIQIKTTEELDAIFDRIYSLHDEYDKAKNVIYKKRDVQYLIRGVILQLKRIVERA